MSDETELPDGIDESERDAWDAFVTNIGGTPSADEFRDAYAGEWSSLEDYADEFVRECYEVPGWVEYYIDYSLMVRDWELNGDIWTERASGGSFFVFRNI